MDDLQFEELRQLQIDTKRLIDELKDVTKQYSEKYVEPPTELKVTGNVKVNTEKEVAVTNIERVVDGLNELSDKITDSIQKNSHKPLESVTVKNLKFPTEYKVNNLHELTPLLVQAIKELEIKPVVNVEKQTITFPRLAKDAIPVRLSDGKGFYNAVFQSNVNSAVEVDPLVGYQISDEATSGQYKYYGYVRKNGAWYIMREDTTNKRYRYAVGAPRDSGGGLYTDAWNNKTNLTYIYFYEVW